jgi:para-nitrobenzyl esterase
VDPRRRVLPRLGGGSSYDGANLAQKNVVVVTINYRLGPFGFLCHPALSKESGRGASGNYGLLDQIEALRWVQRNIATFGGDPKNVTIFGESAGGFSIGCLLISPLAKGLFQRAIAESGVAIWITRKLKEGSATEPAAEDSGVRVLKALVGDATDVLAAARAKSAAEVLKAGNPGLRLTAVGDTVSYGPVTDGWVIPEEPWRLFEEGKVNLVPFLAGTNADEGTMFLGEGAGMTADQHDAQIHSAYGAAGDRLATFYSVKRWQSVASARSQMIGDSIFVAPTRAQVRALSDAGAHCYLYQFTRITGRNFMGAYHSAEIAYVFGHVDNRIMQRYDATDQKLSATMMDYWVQFARTGDPNREGLPTWPVYVTEKDPHLELGDTVKAGTGLHADACDLWDELMASWRKP